MNYITTEQLNTLQYALASSKEALENAQDTIQKLRDTLIEVQNMVGIYKNPTNTIPDYVNKRLEETETNIAEVLENNKSW
tara:strand:+ start:1019 stop:1258 length:240 start_codon:yes stop_codon:yes gene_type:complete